MKNLIKSDSYKLHKASYFWICMIICIAAAFIVTFLFDFTYKLADNPLQGIPANNGIPASMSESLSGFPTSLSGSNMLLSQFASIPIILIAVFVSLFVGGEFSHGTIKNLASKHFSRKQIYLSKLFVSIKGTIMFSLVYVVSATLVGTALWGFGDVPNGFLSTTLKVGLIEFLLASAIASVFVMISIFVRQNGIAIAFSICVLEFGSLIANLGEFLIYTIFNKKVSLATYLLDINMLELSNSPNTNKVVIKSICVGLFFLIIPTLIGIMNFQKRDIK